MPFETEQCQGSTIGIKERREVKPAAVHHIEHAATELATPPTSCLQRIIVRPMMSPSGDAHGERGPGSIDVTGAIVESIACELWKRFGGNDVLNRLEAESLLQDALTAIRRREDMEPLGV